MILKSMLKTHYLLQSEADEEKGVSLVSQQAACILAERSACLSIISMDNRRYFD